MLKAGFLIVLLGLVAISVIAQADENPLMNAKDSLAGAVDDDYLLLDFDTLAIVQEQPSFPGGLDAIGRLLTDSMRYPEKEFKAGIGARVLVSFIVSVDGQVDSAWVQEPGVDALDAEAIRLALLLDGWEPGKMNGKPVKVTYVMPMNFAAEGERAYRKRLRAERKNTDRQKP